MPNLLPYNESDFIWPKGASYFGEPLPYLVDASDGKRMVAYGDWWTPKRIDALSTWTATAHRELMQVCGNDRSQELRGRARVMREMAEATGKRLSVPEMMAFAPDPVQRARIDELTREWAETREWVRSSLSEARSRLGDVAGDLPGDADTWDAVMLTFAALRLPKLLLKLVALGVLTHPGTIVPDHALA